MLMGFIQSEIKKWTRDSLMGFMAVYPIAFALIGRYLLPWISKRYGFDFTPFADLVLVILVLVIPMSYGALIGFSILEDRDGNILTNIQVTPLNVHKFIGFKLILVYILCVLSTIFVMWFSQIGEIPMGRIIGISILASLEAPISGLLINAFAKNKIEGFAIMKGGGSIVILPIISLFINGAKELFFAIAPGFWSAKVISSIIRGGGLFLSYNQYYFIGLIYMLGLNILAYRLFIKKTKQ